MNDRWGLWRITYATYEQMAPVGNVPPMPLLTNLSWAEAVKALAEPCTGRHCVKPWPEFR